MRVADVLPVWCAGHFKRGITLTIVGACALHVERSILCGSPVSYAIDPARFAT